MTDKYIKDGELNFIILLLENQIKIAEEKPESLMAAITGIECKRANLQALLELKERRAEDRAREGNNHAEN